VRGAFGTAARPVPEDAELTGGRLSTTDRLLERRLTFVVPLFVLALALGLLGYAAASIEYRELDDAESAEVIGAWAPNGLDCFSKAGCGSLCLPYDDPNDYFHSKQAKDIPYGMCMDGYWWDNCVGGQTVSCARWIRFTGEACKGDFKSLNCTWETDACDGNPDCPLWPWGS